MKYKNINTGDIKTADEIVLIEPHISYNRSNPNLFCGEWRPITIPAIPEYDREIEEVIEGPVEGYTQTWIIQPRTDVDIPTILAGRTESVDDVEWRQYKIDQDKDEKAKWIAKGKPKYTSA